jgi:hypothetical protein
VFVIAILLVAAVCADEKKQDEVARPGRRGLFDDPFFRAWGTPFHELRRIQRDMDHVWNSLFEPNQQRAASALGESAQKSPDAAQDGKAGDSSAMSLSVPTIDFWPLVDVRETDKAISVHAELPGVKREDVDVRSLEFGPNAIGLTAVCR